VRLGDVGQVELEELVLAVGLAVMSEPAALPVARVPANAARVVAHLLLEGVEDAVRIRQARLVEEDDADVAERLEERSGRLPAGAVGVHDDAHLAEALQILEVVLPRLRAHEAHGRVAEPPCGNGVGVTLAEVRDLFLRGHRHVERRLDAVLVLVLCIARKHSPARVEPVPVQLPHGEEDGRAAPLVRLEADVETSEGLAIRSPRVTLSQECVY
jgi:hypothetical protein